MLVRVFIKLSARSCSSEGQNGQSFYLSGKRAHTGFQEGAGIASQARSPKVRGLGLCQTYHPEMRSCGENAVVRMHCSGSESVGVELHRWSIGRRQNERKLQLHFAANQDVHPGGDRSCTDKHLRSMYEGLS